MADRVQMEIVQADEELGKIVIEVDESTAPATVQNFLRYVDEGFYDGTIFHRIIPTFMIQGGGHVAGFGQKEAPHEPVENEAQRGLKNERGTIAMARTSEPHSATSQFFINVRDNTSLNHPGHDGWGYCAFGRVVDGMDVVDRIKDTPTTSDPFSGERSRPLTPPTIRQARRMPAEP